MISAYVRAVPIMVAVHCAGLLSACESGTSRSCLYRVADTSYAPFDDDSLLGFSANDVIALVHEQGTGNLTWVSGEKTTVTFEVQGGSEARINAPPPGRGFCNASLGAQGVTIRVRTSDDRLDVELASRIVAIGRDGVIEFVFPFEARHTLGPERVDLPIPGSWISDKRPSEELALQFRIQMATDQSPYCLIGEEESADPNDRCNIFAGRIVFSGSDPDALYIYSPKDSPVPVSEDSNFSSALAWWTWDSDGA